MKKTIELKSILSLMLAIAIFSFVSCSNLNEFELDTVNFADSKDKNLEECYVNESNISENDALVMAANFIGLPTYISNTPYEILEIPVSNDVSNNVSSSILAYVVDFGEDYGHVVIANNNRIWPLIAEKYHGNTSFKKEQLTDVFLAELESDILQLQKENTRASNNALSTTEHYHWFKPQFIEIDVDEFAPFNQFVAKHHLRCNAGSVIETVRSRMNSSV